MAVPEQGLSSQQESALGPEDPPIARVPTMVRSVQPLRVRGLMLLVLLTAVLIWSGLAIYGAMSPATRWSRQLRSDRIEDRLLAVEQLAQLGATETSAAIPPLIVALQDEDEGVASTAAVSLPGAARLALASRSVGSARSVVSALLVAADDPRPRVRVSAVSALGISQVPTAAPDLLESVVETLCLRLTDESEDVRWQAARTLAAIGPDSQTPVPTMLVDAMESDASSRVRIEAARGAGLFPARDGRAAMILLEGLGSSDSEWKAACEIGLRGLQNMGMGYSPPKRVTAQNVPALTEAMSHPDRLVRYHAAILLGELGREAEEAVPALVVEMNKPIGEDRPAGSAYLNGNSWEPACKAAEALGRVAPGTERESEAAAALVQHLETGSNLWRRGNAATALLKFPRSSVAPGIPSLLRTLDATKNDQGSPAAEICAVLAGVGPGSDQGAEVLDALVRVLKESTWGYTRVEAAKAIPAFGRLAVARIPELRAILTQSPTPAVDTAVNDAILRIESIPKARSGTKTQGS